MAVIEDSVEERIARLESELAHVRSDIGDMKLDIRELRTLSSGMQRDLADVRKSIEHSIRVGQIWTVTVAAALLGAMARGFGWI